MTETDYCTPFFGERWNVPALEEGVQVPTPVGELCLYCVEAIEEGDQGTITTYVQRGADAHPLVTVVPIHRECQLRQVMGGINCLTRQHSRCSGGPEPDTDPPGVSRREAAKLVLEWSRAHGGAQ